MVIDNAELAYLLGMITGKGQIRRRSADTDILIEIPHKNLISEGMDARLSVKASLDDIRNILEGLIGTRIQSAQLDNKTVITFSKPNDDFLIREINRHFNRVNSCKNFRIPPEIFHSSPDIKKEFMIGLADVTAHIRSSNAAFGISYNNRVYIEIPVNWFLVVDIGNLLRDLDVPVHTIDWGHPNMRDPNLEDYKKDRQNAWFREHQIKIFADEFEKVGFRLVHKMRALKDLADKNRVEWDKHIRKLISGSRSDRMRKKYELLLGHIEAAHHKYYWETKEIEKTKPFHPMENGEKIPSEIRGRHFNSWKDLCIALGYTKA